jgi:type II secretory pathway predicted ATPase ExeA
MYETWWGLREAPFDNTPNPRFFYLSPEHADALARLAYAIRQRKGLALLTGEHGCGKTTLARVLLGRLDAERHEIALLTNPVWSPVDFLREILYQLGIETSERGKPELLHQINEALYRHHEAARDTVVVVDEAQMIDDDRVLDELRLLLNFETDDRILVTVLLIGATELAARVRRLVSLDQRVAARYHLTPLDEDHTGRYIRHRLRIAGATTPIITDDATRLVYDFTRGTPREVNNVCDLALLEGSVRKVRQVDQTLVADVIKERVGLVG